MEHDVRHDCAMSSALGVMWYDESGRGATHVDAANVPTHQEADTARFGKIYGCLVFGLELRIGQKRLEGNCHGFGKGRDSAK